MNFLTAVAVKDVIMNGLSIASKVLHFKSVMLKSFLPGSKTCQKVNWKNVHEHVCKSSKFRLKAGSSVRLEGLKKKPEFNVKIATIVSFVKEKGRFVIDLEDEALSLKPQNLVLVDNT